MAAIRLLLIVATLIGFFLVGMPLQLLVARARPDFAHRMTRLLCRSLLRLARVRVVVEGSWTPARPMMAAANHVSWIDILALAALAPFCFLAKREVSRWPLISAFAALQGTVFVDRLRRRSIPVANRAMAARMLEGRMVLLFPEGTTLAGPEPGVFRSSHFAAARDLVAAEPSRAPVAIQPVALGYSDACAAWIDDEALLPHVWRVLRQPPLTCRIRFGEPIAYTAGGDRKAVARLSRDAVAGLLSAGVVADCASVRIERLDAAPAATPLTARG